jgi:hypothetical protein
MTDDQIKHMVNRFLSWKLPRDTFNPDCGISFNKAPINTHTPWPSQYEPSGTNLFDAMQANAMVRHMIEGMPAPADDPVEPVAFAAPACTNCSDQTELVNGLCGMCREMGAAPADAEPVAWVAVVNGEPIAPMYGSRQSAERHSLGLEIRGMCFCRPASPVMAEWQPMETIPRGGEDFLVSEANGGVCIVVSWDSENSECPLITWDGPSYRLDLFSHWMPLPAPPALAKLRAERGDAIPTYDREELRALCLDLASVNLTKEAAERQADRIADGIVASISRPERSTESSAPENGGAK